MLGCCLVAQEEPGADPAFPGGGMAWRLWWAQAEGHYRLEGLHLAIRDWPLREVRLRIDDAAVSPFLDWHFDPIRELGIAGGLSIYHHRVSQAVKATGLRLDQPTAILPVEVGYDLIDVHVEALYYPWREADAEIGIGAGLHFINARVAPGLFGEVISVDEQFWIPTSVARGRWEPWRGWAVEGRGHFLRVRIGGDDFDLLDLVGVAVFRPAENFGVEVGYRFYGAALEFGQVQGAQFWGDQDLDVDLHGPLVGVMMRF